LENSICKGLLRLSLEHDVSPFTLTLATFAILLRKYTREVKIFHKKKKREEEEEGKKKKKKKEEEEFMQ